MVNYEVFANLYGTALNEEIEKHECSNIVKEVLNNSKEEIVKHLVNMFVNKAECYFNAREAIKNIIHYNTFNIYFECSGDCEHCNKKDHFSLEALAETYERLDEVAEEAYNIHHSALEDTSDTIKTK